MSIRKRGSVYWIDFTITNTDGISKRVQESAKTTDKTLAQELHDKRRAEMWREMKLGEVTSKSWADAVKLYTTEKNHLRSMSATVSVNINWLNERIKPDTKLSSIEGMLPDIRRSRIEQTTTRGTPPKQATINMPLAILSSILKLAAKRGYMKQAPQIDLPNPQNTRTRWISREESMKLLGYLRDTGKVALANLVEFSFETGLRQSNAVSLRSSNIDLANKRVMIKREDFKGKRDFATPFSGRAFQLVVRGIANDNGYIFATEKGKRFANPNEQLKEACAAVGIEDFHWHDIRHTWATWHVRAGTPLEVLQKLGGWRDYSMVLRYAVFAQDHIAAYADNISKGDGVVVVTPIKEAA